MYAHDSFRECKVPECEEDLRALVLLATLKRSPEDSNTQELAELVLENLKKYDVVAAEIVRLADLNILSGLGETEGEDDDFPPSPRRSRPPTSSSTRPLSGGA